MSTPDKGSLVIVRDPLLPSELSRERTEIDFLRPLVEVLPAEVKAKPDAWAIIENGKVIDAEYWETHIVKPAAQLTCVPRIGGKNAMSFAMGALLIGLSMTGIGGALSPILLSLGLGMVAQGVIGLFTKAPSGNRGGSSDPSYGFGAITNRVQPGAIIPVVYGTMVVGGLVVARSVKVAYTKSAWGGLGQTLLLDQHAQSNTEVLDQITLLSEGPVGGVDIYRVNGGPASAYEFAHSFTLGYARQTPLDVFDKVGTRSSYSHGIDLGTTVYTTQADDVTRLEFVLLFPGGLFMIDREDKTGEKITTASVSIAVELKRLDANGNVIETKLTQISTSAAKKSAFRTNGIIDELPSGRYLVNMWRNGSTSENPIVSDAVMLGTITEVTGARFTYPYCAMAGVTRFLASQSGGSLPTFSYLVQGRLVRVFFGNSDAFTYSLSGSSNPAWIALDILTNERYGMGNHVWAAVHRRGTVAVESGSDIVTGTDVGDWRLKVRPGMHLDVHTSTLNGTPSFGRVVRIAEVLSANTLRLVFPWQGSTVSGRTYAVREPDLDVTAWTGFAARCDEFLPGGTRRAEFNGVFESDRWDAWESAQKVCSVGLGQPVRLGNVCSVVWQAPAEPVQIFSSANIIPGSFKFTLPDMQARANYFQIAYLDRDDEYRAEAVNWRDPDTIINQEPEVRFESEGFGVTSRLQAAYLSRWYRRVNKGRGAIIEFEVSRDALACTVNDVFLFQHDAIDSSWSGRCVSGGDSTMAVLDQSVTLIPGTTYTLQIRHNGYWLGNEYTDGDLIEERTVGGATVFGEPTNEIFFTSPLTSTPRLGDIYVLGTAQQLPSRPYRIIELSRAQEFTAKIVAVEYDETVYDDSVIDVTRPVIVNDPILSVPTVPPQVTDIRVVGQFVLWTPGSPEWLTASVDVYDVKANGTLQYLENTPNGYYRLPESFQDPGTTFTLKIVPVGVTGIRADVTAAETLTYTTPLLVGPPKPTGLELIEGGQGLGNQFEYAGTDPEFRWRYRGLVRGFGIADLHRESLGVNSTGIDPTFRDFEIRVFDAGGELRRTEYQYSNRWQYTAVKRTADGVGTTFTLKVRARNSSGVLSLVAAAITVSPAA